MDVQVIRTPGLGDTSYLLTHEGTAVLVDPQRDVDRFLRAADAAGAELRWVVETHVHNDYVSGALTLARRTGARLVLPAGSGAAYPHTPAFHGEDLRDGALTLRPLHTPGHTPEHCSYLVLVDGDPVGVFTGGSLLVRAAGRTDLLGQDRARQLARLQHASLQRLAALPDEVAVYPTHGEGSFCSASSSAGGATTSLIGDERRLNPALRHADAEAFADAELAGLGPYPTYYAHMAPINVRGPEPMPDRRAPQLAAADVRALAGAAAILDLRPRASFAAGHIAGSIGIELGARFGTWAGWLLPFASPVVLVADADQDVAEAVTQLARIGFEDVRGVLRGIHAWRSDGGPLASYQLTTTGEVAARAGSAQVLDVRSPAEWEAGHLEASVHRYLPHLVTGLPEALDPERPVVVACETGYRSSIAAGLVERHGYEPVVLTGGGVPDVLELLNPAVPA